jgi:hypothetical protein
LRHEELDEEMVQPIALGGETGTLAKAVVEVPHALPEKEFHDHAPRRSSSVTI